MVCATSNDEVNKMIKELRKKFSKLKQIAKECLVKCEISVTEVADTLTSLSPDDDKHHKMFLKSHVKVLYAAADNSELFGTMNFHWNYLDPSLLGYLVEELDLKDVEGDIDAYKSNLQLFRLTTPLSLFYQTQTPRNITPPPDFRKIKAKFKFTDKATLEDVERFRRMYASHYKVHYFAMMIAQVLPGSFIISWFIPLSLVDKFKENVPTALLMKYSVLKLEIAGTCVYKDKVHCHQPSFAQLYHSVHFPTQKSPNYRHKHLTCSKFSKIIDPLLEMLCLL